MEGLRGDRVPDPPFIVMQERKKNRKGERRKKEKVGALGNLKPQIFPQGIRNNAPERFL